MIFAYFCVVYRALYQLRRSTFVFRYWPRGRHLYIPVSDFKCRFAVLLTLAVVVVVAAATTTTRLRYIHHPPPKHSTPPPTFLPFPPPRPFLPEPSTDAVSSRPNAAGFSLYHLSVCAVVVARVCVRYT